MSGLDGMYLYSPRDAARFLGVGKTKLYELLGNGELESLHIGSARRIPLASLREFIDTKMSRTDQALVCTEGFEGDRSNAHHLSDNTD